MTHAALRRALLCAAAALLAGCGAPVAGAPVPAAGFGAGPATTSAPPQVSGGVSTPAIPQPRALSGVDTCTLVEAGELAEAGGLASAPKPRTAAFPESCSFPLGGGAAGDVVLVAFYKPYEQVRQDQPKGHEEKTLGHSTWVYCGVSEGYRTCVAAVAVRADRSLVVALDKRDAAEEAVLGLLQPLTEKALGRLPQQ